MDNVIRWHVNKVANNPCMLEIIGKCGSLSMEKKMITMGYCFAIIALQTNGILSQPIPVPEYEMNGDNIIIMLYVLFKKEEDRNNCIQMVAANLSKFS